MPPRTSKRERGNERKRELEKEGRKKREKEGLERTERKGARGLGQERKITNPTCAKAHSNSW
jgi:hypothetical protein